MEETSLQFTPNTTPANGAGDAGFLEHAASRSAVRPRAAALSSPIPAMDASAMPFPSHREPPTSAAHDVPEVLPAPRLEAFTRMVNVVIAAVALLLLAPICVLVALAVKVASKGPVFYAPTRVGMDRRWNRTTALRERRVEDLGGQPFTILKFRSMRTDAEANGQAVWATKHDSRITPIGHVLRKTRLDEIPQLINVLRGEMNVVGPRPERPSIVVRLRTDIPEYPQRHRVKPGITGWAQINHSYDSCLEDVRTKVRYDLEYISKQSIWFDLKIMLLTLPVMLFRKGAH
jgi:lipopolysaccharide/colanic/teichoic acid biosynthesis glycosyltransferase